jgi:uncharacterized protein
MPTYKTPDVYIEEISVFPPSVAEVETAIPAFIGYTEKAIKNAADDLILKPTKIYSLKEYELHFGNPKDDDISLTVGNDPIKGLVVSVFTEPAVKYLLYYSVKMFFENGGGQCYIIAVGTYQPTPAIDLTGGPTTFGLQDGLEALALEDEPTLIVIPEAVKLSVTDYQSLMQAVLLQCEKLRDRFAILDIYAGEASLNPAELSTNRSYFGNNNLKYGAAYYPFLKTTINFFVNDAETNVKVTPPTGVGATATASLGTVSVISEINITAGGSGYTSAPTVTLSGGGGTGATATAAVAAGVVTAVTLTAGGSGYTSAPTVSFSGGGGTGAAATAITATAPGSTVATIAVTSGGNGYNAAPTVGFTGGGGTGAAATAVVAAGVVTAVNVTTPGSGYTTAPTITFTPSAVASSVNLATLKDPAAPNTALYNFVKNVLKEHFVKLPPSGAIAGIYAATDSNRGVWKAPANTSLANVIEPVIKLDNARQDDLNVDATTGKSINAIRAFMGKGTLVWGARTLAGNDNEWRYIPVRRFFSVVEESIKKSIYWAVFEPNDANTWVKVRGMIENYLNQKWREGALAGATPKEAFFVKCGLGVTMTSQDILEGRMNVEIGMAVVRPAEFIILKFSHKLQTS